MKKNLLIPVLCFFFIGAALPGFIQAEVDLVGTWVGPAAMEGQPDNELTLVLEKKDGKLAGTVTGQYDTLSDTPLENIKVEGNVFSFEVMAETGGGGIKIVFKVTVTGDKMAGEFEAPDMGMSGTWEAEKQKG